MQRFHHGARRSAQPARLTLGLCALGLLASCESLIGLESRTYEDGGVNAGAGSDGGTDGGKADAGPPPTTVCREYCNAVMVCKDAKDKDNQYVSDEECLAFCALLPPGTPGEVDETNNVECRKHALGDTEQLKFTCGIGGPTGGNYCGDSCETYCELFDKTCVGPANADDETKAEFFCGDPKNPRNAAACSANKEDCVAKCKGLRVNNATDAFPGGTYDINDNYHDDDSLQCRYRHLVTAATTTFKDHCGHAALKSNLHCYDEGKNPPKCEDYCRLIVRGACRGDDAVYESEDQCVAACTAMDKAGKIGKNGDYRQPDTTTDTVGCRLNHAYFALDRTTPHCAHAGPGGAGGCGDNCEYLCLYQQAACPSATQNEQDCRAACGKLRGAADTTYSIAAGKKGGDNFECRMLHTMRALQSPPTSADRAKECLIARGTTTPCPAEK